MNLLDSNLNSSSRLDNDLQELYSQFTNMIKNKDWPPRFKLHQKNILNLLTGNRFYSNASASLREAILNAIDAINRRKEIDKNLQPEINVTFQNDKKSVLISDNGEGMNKDTIEKLFSTIGASITNLKDSPDSVGEFGIGVISYFLAGESFTIQSFNGTDPKIGLRFRKEMISGERAEIIQGNRIKRGTSLELNVRDTKTFNILLERYSHWCRDVEGLSAVILPDGKKLNQGNIDRPDTLQNLHEPNWVERSFLSPISSPPGWYSMSGDSIISVLYKGIFVQDFTVKKLWGINGSIDVDPKHFKPMLNRESFIGEEFKKEVENFMQKVHPRILQEMAHHISVAFRNKKLNKWTEQKWATLWLSIPRNNKYLKAAKEWDDIFRKIPVFEYAEVGKWKTITLNHLLKLENSIYVAPQKNQNINKEKKDLVSAAMHYLRNTERNVIRGISPENKWRREIGYSSFNTTADLVAKVFKEELPKFKYIVNDCENILKSINKIATVYDDNPSVEIVKLGKESAPILSLKSQLIINIDHPKGKLIIDELLTENSGRWSLIEITARNSYNHLSQVAASVKNYPNQREKLGLVKRRYIRNLLS